MLKCEEELAEFLILTRTNGPVGAEEVARSTKRDRSRSRRAL